MSLARYFVFERDDAWLVTLNGGAIARHESRTDAVNSAIVMADLMGSMKHDADVMLEAAGRLELAWTYGKDAVPVAGMAAA